MKLSIAPLLMLSVGMVAAAEPPRLSADAPRLLLEAPNLAAIHAEDALPGKPGPWRYAVPIEVGEARAKAILEAWWMDLPDGRKEKRFVVEAPGGKTLDLIFEDFWLPHGAELWVLQQDGKLRHGPYTDAHNNPQRVLATPVTLGERATVVLVAPPELTAHVSARLTKVHYGYRGFEAIDGMPVPKAGTCNVDTICPQGDPWREQIRAVGRYTVAGGLCTGTLVNNTAQNRRPLFLTARHCFSTQADASTVVVFWRYESSTCRAVGSAANGQQILPVPTTFTNSGSQLLMSFNNADMTLVELNQPVPAGAQPFYVGWDRRDRTPSAAVAIHHPQGHEKRISFENDPLTIGSFNNSGIVLPSSLRVNDWDLGTTEQGSSGSALFDAGSRRLMGTLAGGAAACGNDLDDHYGRVFIGWTGGGFASTRLRDHLDPNSTGVEVLDGLEGTGGGGSLQLALTIRQGAVLQAGLDGQLDFTVSGGAGPFTVTLDIDGDGVTDRTLGNVPAGVQQTVLVRYPRSANLTLRGTASAGGSSAQAQFGLAVTAPDVRASFGAAQQICGDGDNLIEPGEQWRIPVSLQNFGGAATSANNSFAIVSKEVLGGGGGGGGIGAPLATDAFGYQLRDTTTGACGFNFLDLSGVAPQQLTASSPSFPANDDGVTPALSLQSQDGTSYAFELYGQTIDAIRASTNGYLSANLNIIGNDFTPNCDASPTTDGGNRRLNALHHDLVVQDVRVAVAPTCPRNSDVGPASQRCLVVQWTGARLFGNVPGTFDIQAVIYPQSRSIVYQVRGTLPTIPDFGIATIGLQRPPATPFNYTCTSARRPIVANRAVCYYHPGNLPSAAPAEPSGSAKLTGAQLRLLTPALATAGMAPSATVSRNVDFHIDAAANCNSSFRLRYEGNVDERSYSGVAADRTVEVGGAGCAPVTTCPAPTVPSQLKPGAHFNPLRSGNGFISYPAGDPAAPVLFSTWFTAEPNRNPTWYIVQEAIQQNQVNSPIFRFARNGNPPTWVVPTSTQIGRAQVTFISPGRMVLTHQFDGQPRGGEMLVLVTDGLPTGNPNRSGAWFNPAESGWGFTVDSFQSGGVTQDFIVNFLYDNSGAPRWVLGQGPAGVLQALAFEVHCPNCGWVQLPDSRVVGSINRNLGASTGTYTISTDTGAPQQVNWQRSNFPVQLLTLPP